MKNMVLLSSFLFLLFSCGDGNTDVSSSFPGAGVQSIDLTGFDVTDLPGGYQQVVRKDANGKITEEGIVRDGKRNGTWVIYNDRRPLAKSVANFVDDQYSGTYLEFSNTGQLELICHYRANKLHGKFIKVKNTRKLEEGYYEEGELDGIYKKYYPNKETLQQEVSYKMGKLHGPSKYYNEEGQLVMEYEYKNGKKISGGLVDPKSSQTNKTE